jgi:hypothetical protein
MIGNEMIVQYARGSQGQRLSSLYNWLYQEKPYNQGVSAQVLQETYLRGIPIKYTMDQVRHIANEAYAAEGQQSKTFHSWYVCIDGKRFSTKWLVRQLTGLSCSQFTTGEACRVLRKLGIAVNRMAFDEEKDTDCS